MITITSEQLSGDEKKLTDTSYHHQNNVAGSQSATTTHPDTDITNQLLLPSKFITHTHKAGLNPLVDTAAYLFSVIGKLKQIKSYHHQNKLRKELIQEINTFQDAAKAHGYSSEYILVSRYAICATLDDIISNTSWGGQGQWQSNNLLTAFNQESASQDRFFVILEQIIKDPHLYIDVMEFMYICLSLGFKGHYRYTEYNNNQLEQITSSLYKRIRAHRGDFSKTLSPFPIKPTAPPKPAAKKTTSWAAVYFAIGVGLAFIAGISYMVNTTSSPSYPDSTRMGKSIPYETHDKTVE